MSKALQEFDLALRGKKKRDKFLKDGRKKKELTVKTQHWLPVCSILSWL